MAAVQETLKINITAENKEAVAALQQMQNELAKLKRSLNKATDTSEIQALQMKIQNLNGSIATASAQFVKTGDVVKKSSATYMNLGRVIQDLPFGFQGIQNNLTQLIPSVGALGLAFSAVVSAITFAQVGLQFWTKESKAAQKSTDDFTEALSKNIGQAKADIAQIETLVAITTNATKSTDERKRALNLLKEEYPGFLELQKADINDADTLKRVTDQLSGAILRKARVEAFSRLIAEEEAAQAKVTIENDKQRLNRLDGLTKAVNDYVLPLLKLSSATEANTVNTLIQNKAIDGAVDQYNNSSNAIKKLRELLTKTTEDQIKFNDAVILGGGPKGKGFTQASIKAELLNQQLKERLNLQARIARGPIEQSNIDRSKQGQGELGQAGQTSFQRLVEFQRGLMGADEALRLYNEYASEAGQITTVFATSFTDLSNALLQGQSVGEAIGNVFRKLAADIAAAAIKALLFKSILGALTGGTSTALGALAGKGTSFGSLFGGFLGLGAKPFADGGVVNKPTLGVFGEAGSEAIMPLNKLNSMLMTASQLGGGGMANMEIMTKVSGSDLLLWFQRAGYSRNLQR